MSEKQLRDMIAFASVQCDRIFATTGVLHPLWHAVTSSGETLIETPPFNDKDMAVAMIRALFDLKDVVRYVFVDEAWTLLKMVQPDEMKVIEREGLSKHPERVEIVMIQGEDSEYGQIVTHREIIRPAKGKAYLGPIQTLDDMPHVPPGGTVQSQGRMVGLLPVRGARH
jgi:hypothetical protein